MATFFDNVSGCLLDIKEFHTSIPFTSPSDVLFASLFVKYKDSVEMQLMNDLLTLFRHPKFHSEKVTFKEIEDISIHIADERQAIMRTRNTKGDVDLATYGHRITGDPRTWKLVLELVAEYLDSHRAPFHRYPTSECSDPYCYVNRTFASMALVHRSWTGIAQQYSRRRIHIGVYQGIEIQSLLQNPTIGPWVRDLSVVGTAQGGEDINVLPWMKREIPRSLLKVLDRCPNIKRLRLNTPFNTEYLTVNGSKRNIMRLIRSLRHLEDLWLGDDCGLGCDDIRELTSTISDLQYLNTLSIEMPNGWREFPGTHDPLNLTDTTLLAPATLTTLSLIKMGGIATALMSWIMNSSRGGHITKLEVSLKSMLHPGHTNGGIVVDPTLKSCATTHVTTLRLSVDAYEWDVLPFLELFPSLKYVNLDDARPSDFNESLRRKPFVLPVSVTDLRLSFPGLYGQSFDDYMLATMKVNPNVKRILANYMTWYSDGVAKYDVASEYAAMNNVDLEVESGFHTTPLLDM